MSLEIVKSYEPLWGDWTIEQLIGRGSAGEVYKISKELYGKKYYSALKFLSVPNEDSYNDYVNSTGITNKSEINQYFETVIQNMSNEIALLYELKVR